MRNGIRGVNISADAITDMRQYIKPMTRPAKTSAGEEIEVRVTERKSDYYSEVLEEPFYDAISDRWYDRGRVFHWTELTFLD